jgi:hypothetical protein
MNKEEVEKIINEIEFMWEVIGKNMKIGEYKGKDKGYKNILTDLGKLADKLEQDDIFAKDFLEKYNIVGDDDFEAKRKFFIYLVRLFVYWLHFGDGLKEIVNENKRKKGEK